MKNTRSRFVVVLCAILVSGSSAAVTPTPVKVTLTPVVIKDQGRQFVGVSEQTGTGGSGYAVLSRMCDALYRGSRMCTIDEYLNSIHPAAHPQTHGFAFIRDASLPVPGLTNCFGWRSNAGNSGNAPSAMIVDGTGGIASGVCADSRPVACCK